MGESVKEQVIGLLRKRESVPATIGDNGSLDFMQAGYIDSIGLIRLVVELEECFDMDIDDSDIEQPGFTTVDGLVSILTTRLNAVSG